MFRATGKGRIPASVPAIAEALACRRFGRIQLLPEEIAFEAEAGLVLARVHIALALEEGAGRCRAVHVQLADAPGARPGFDGGHQRAVDEQALGAAAEVAAWTAVAVFFVARNRWNQPANDRTLADLLTATLEEYLSA